MSRAAQGQGRRAVVVGGGISGLAAAGLLARRGWSVDLLEAQDTLGGRAGTWEADGFRFDTGPSWYLMPEVFERFKTVKKEKWVEGCMVKGRNEPCMIERVATIIAGIKGVSVEEVCEAAWANTVKVFGLEN